MRTVEYNQSYRSPSLFSSTTDLEFFSSDASLVHQILKPGPKDFTVVKVTSTGHSAGFVENNRTAITLPTCGHADARVGKRNFSVWLGDMVALGPSERHSELRADDSAGVYRSYTVISPPNWPHGMPDDTLYRTPAPKSLKLLELLRFSFSYRSNPVVVSERTVLLHEALVEDALVEALRLSDSGGVTSASQNRYESVVRKTRRTGAPVGSAERPTYGTAR